MRLLPKAEKGFHALASAALYTTADPKHNHLKSLVDDPRHVVKKIFEVHQGVFKHSNHKPLS